jgi:hypothetical protein
VVAHAVRKLLRTAIAIISLRIIVTSLREANAPAPPCGVTLVYDRGPNIWGSGQGGSGAAFAPAARAAAISPPLIPPSRAELFTLANAASPASFRGSEEYFGAGAADETLRMAKGSAT